MAAKSSWGLSGNQLKLIGILLMTIDHVGMLILPQWEILRIIGRLTMPIFAYMIAEGFVHTRSKRKYLLRLAVTAMLIQIVQYFMGGAMYLYHSIMTTFSLSLVLMLCLDFARKRNLFAWLLPLGFCFAIWFVCERLENYLPGFAVDYGFFGVLLPVIIHLGQDRLSRWWLTAFGLAALCWYLGGLQWYSMAALLPLALYNGRRGKANLKWLFYLYYPAHLAVIYLLRNYLN